MAGFFASNFAPVGGLSVRQFTLVSYWLCNGLYKASGARARLMRKPVEDEAVVWTPNMPDRRLTDRRNGIDRRAVNGRQMLVPDMRAGDDRRSDDRRRVRLTITGRAMDAGESNE